MEGNGRQTGILIAVEGIDGAGKTTQVELLYNALVGVGETVVRSKEPTDGPHGRRLRESAQNGRLDPHEELETFIADRREHVETKIRPALARGEIVILDRYYYSTIAYQGARGELDPCELNEQMRRQFPVPDITFLIDVLPEVGLHRIARLRGDTPNEFERVEALTHVREMFKALLECAPEIYLVDGHAAIDTVFHDIAHRLVDTALKAKRCVKPYDCDVFYCSYRETGECKWPAERARLLQKPAQATPE